MSSRIEPENSVVSDAVNTISTYGPGEPKPPASILPILGLFIGLGFAVYGVVCVFGDRSYADLIVVAAGLLFAVFLIGWGERAVLKSIRSKSASASAVLGASQLATIQEQLLRYQNLTRDQASRAFWVGQIACAIGFGTIIGGSYVVVRQAESTSAQIVVGGLSALGAVLTSFIGATFFRTYKQAQIQMNFYYAQPLVHSYLLQAEELSRRLQSSEAADTALGKVIDQTLEVAAVAAQLIKPDSDTPDGTRKNLRPRPSDTAKGPGRAGG